jgi:hypothetical protein
VEYEITPKSGLTEWMRRKRDEFSLTLSFENFGDRFLESLEIDAEGLEPDEYELTWIVHDVQSGGKVEEKVEFMVINDSSELNE